MTKLSDQNQMGRRESLIAMGSASLASLILPILSDSAVRSGEPMPKKALPLEDQLKRELEKRLSDQNIEPQDPGVMKIVKGLVEEHIAMVDATFANKKLNKNTTVLSNNITRIRVCVDNYLSEKDRQTLLRELKPQYESFQSAYQAVHKQRQNNPQSQALNDQMNQLNLKKSAYQAILKLSGKPTK